MGEALFVFRNVVVAAIFDLRAQRKRLHCRLMHVHKTKFERNSSLEYYHLTCIGKTIKTYKLKRTTGQNKDQ